VSELPWHIGTIVGMLSGPLFAETDKERKEREIWMYAVERAFASFQRHDTEPLSLITVQEA